MDDPRWLDGLRRQGEALAQELGRAYLANLLGEAAEISLVELYGRYPELTARQTFDRLDEAREAAPEEGPERHALGRLLEMVGAEHERAAAAPATERRLAAEATLRVSAAGESVSYRALPVLIRNSAEPARRRAYEEAMLEGAKELSPLVAEEHSRARDGAAELGGEDYVLHRCRLARYDIDELAHTAMALLESTADMAREACTWLLRDHVEDPTAARLTDLWRALRAPGLDGLLRREELYRVDDFLSRLGLDPHGGGRIHRHFEERAGKSSRAFCVQVRVPDEIHLVLRPGGGLPDWRSLLHELGHALHGAGTDRSRPLEDARLGDASVSEGYAILFDHLLQNRVWARQVLKLSVEDTSRLVRTTGAANLLIARRNVAKIPFEIALHRGEGGARDLYADLQRRAVFVEVPAGLHLVDVDPELYSTRYLRAWLFEATAHHELRERYDEDWFRNPRAGEHLRRLFAEGQSRDLDDLTEEELGRGLDVAAFRDRYEELLG